MELDGYGEISARNAVDVDRASKAAAVLPRPLRAQHPEGRLGDGAEPRAALRLGRRADRGDAGGAPGGRRHRPRPRRADRRVVRGRGEPARWSRSCARSGCASSSGEEERPVEGPLTGSTLRDHGHARAAARARRRRPRSRRWAPRSRDSVSKKTTGVIVGESPGSKLAKAQKAGRARPRPRTTSRRCSR